MPSHRNHYENETNYSPQRTECSTEGTRVIATTNKSNLSRSLADYQQAVATSKRELPQKDSSLSSFQLHIYFPVLDLARIVFQLDSVNLLILAVSNIKLPTMARTHYNVISQNPSLKRAAHMWTKIGNAINLASNLCQQNRLTLQANSPHLTFLKLTFFY